jgi:hypothetical protein
MWVHLDALRASVSSTEVSAPICPTCFRRTPVCAIVDFPLSPGFTVKIFAAARQLVNFLGRFGEEACPLRIPDHTELFFECIAQSDRGARPVIPASKSLRAPRSTRLCVAILHRFHRPKLLTAAGPTEEPWRPRHACVGREESEQQSRQRDLFF